MPTGDKAARRVLLDPQPKVSRSVPIFVKCGGSAHRKNPIEIAHGFPCRKPKNDCVKGAKARMAQSSPAWSAAPLHASSDREVQAPSSSIQEKTVHKKFVQHGTFQPKTSSTRCSLKRAQKIAAGWKKLFSCHTFDVGRTECHKLLRFPATLVVAKSCPAKSCSSALHDNSIAAPSCFPA